MRYWTCDILIFSYLWVSYESNHVKLFLKIAVMINIVPLYFVLCSLLYTRTLSSVLTWTHGWPSWGPMELGNLPCSNCSLERWEHSSHHVCELTCTEQLSDWLSTNALFQQCPAPHSQLHMVTPGSLPLSYLNLRFSCVLSSNHLTVWSARTRTWESGDITR